MNGWDDFGFPDPEFMTGLVPLQGLFLALKERVDAAKSYRQTDFFPWPSSVDIGINDLSNRLQQWQPFDFFVFGYFDSVIRDIAQFYINHTVDPVISPDTPVWSLGSLVESLKNRPVFSNGLITNYAMLSQFCTPALVQRKEMIEQLRYLKIGYNADRLFGSCQRSFTQSITENMIEEAENNVTRQTLYCPVINATYRYILDYSYWRTIVQIEQFMNLRADEGVIPPETAAKSFLSINITGPNGFNNLFDSFGTGLTLGINVLPLPYSQWTFPLKPDTFRGLPEGETDFIYGFTGQAVCYVDFSDLFTFFDGGNK